MLREREASSPRRRLGGQDDGPAPLPFGAGWALLVVCALICGCAATGVARRKARAPADYAALSLTHQRLVDQGEICSGMTTNAVFLALGQPSEIEQLTDQGIAKIIWRYHRDWVKQTPYWRWLPTADGHYSYELYYDHAARRYLWAIVIFHNGQVTQWQYYRPPEG